MVTGARLFCTAIADIPIFGRHERAGAPVALCVDDIPPFFDRCSPNRLHVDVNTEAGLLRKRTGVLDPVPRAELVLQ